jgi:uncharacterized damage-inducible protein DinB
MTRTDPELVGDELALLTQFLEFHRATLVDKVSGLTHEQLNTASVPPSTMTLAGMVKHLALVEDDWFQVRLLGRPDPDVWAKATFDEDRDWEWHTAHEQTPAELIALYEGACARSRAAVAEVHGDLNTLSVMPDRHTGGSFSLRWILIHIIEETCRHNGHVDLLREAIDGTVGE